MFVGNIVQGVRIAGAQGRDLGVDDERVCVLQMIIDIGGFQACNLVDIIRQRAQSSPDHVLFTLINAKGTEVDSLSCLQLQRKAERIGSLLMEKAHLNVGDHVALIFPPGIDLIAAFYGCLCVGKCIIMYVCLHFVSSGVVFALHECAQRDK